MGAAQRVSSLKSTKVQFTYTANILAEQIWRRATTKNVCRGDHTLNKTIVCPLTQEPQRITRRPLHPNAHTPSHAQPGLPAVPMPYSDSRP
ncbi:hypothetical protein J6590_047950 [Homalodisca vitripennis]|nr:hypothetical protein J6590_047950 [Homalodisca vitripennis]